jgi:hypothetical protein
MLSNMVDSPVGAGDEHLLLHMWGPCMNSGSLHIWQSGEIQHALSNVVDRSLMSDYIVV